LTTERKQERGTERGRGRDRERKRVRKIEYTLHSNKALERKIGKGRDSCTVETEFLSLSLQYNRDRAPIIIITVQ
jgi:hypothetical protein